MNKPNLTQLNIITRDFDASVTFYERLGLTLAEHSAPELNHRHAEVTLPNGFVFEVDNEGLARTYHAGWRASQGGSRALIGFSLATREDVDRAYAELTAGGGQGKQPPYDAFWGARYAIVADPDGNDVGLMSPIDQQRRQWPPSDSPAS